MFAWQSLEGRVDTSISRNSAGMGDVLDTRGLAHVADMDRNPDRACDYLVKSASAAGVGVETRQSTDLRLQGYDFRKFLQNIKLCSLH